MDSRNFIFRLLMKFISLDMVLYLICGFVIVQLKCFNINSFELCIWAFLSVLFYLTPLFLLDLTLAFLSLYLRSCRYFYLSYHLTDILWCYGWLNRILDNYCFMFFLLYKAMVIFCENRKLNTRISKNNCKYNN